MSTEIINGFKFETFTIKGCIVPVNFELLEMLNVEGIRHFNAYKIEEVVEQIETDGLEEYEYTDKSEIEELKACIKLLDDGKVDYIEFELAL